MDKTSIGQVKPRHVAIAVLIAAIWGVNFVVIDVGLDSLPPLPSDIDSVAICLLHSDRNPAHEVALAAHLRAEGHDVTASHELSPEFREYERTTTTVINAYVASRCRAYLDGLSTVADDVLVMTSAGGLFEFCRNNVRLDGSMGFAGDFRDEEWAGACFSPDGKWLFANVYSPGFTVAITGPWKDGLI